MKAYFVTAMLGLTLAFATAQEAFKKECVSRSAGVSCKGAIGEYDFTFTGVPGAVRERLTLFRGRTHYSFDDKVTNLLKQPYGIIPPFDAATKIVTDGNDNLVERCVWPAREGEATCDEVELKALEPTVRKILLEIGRQ